VMRPRTLIIAEAGVNHNGDMALAHKLVDAAAEAGADLVKFQTFSAEALVAKDAPKADYQKRLTAGEENQFGMLKRLELSPANHRSLMDWCQERGIGFFSTGFDLASLDFLEGLGFTRHKVPSGEITNYPYLRKMGSFGKEVLLSTGMADLGEIEAALRVLEESGTSREKVIVLHCTTEYPTPMDEVNLRAMRAIGEAFGVRVGYSDHTPGIEIPIAAVALGATVIEKHFTLDRNLPGPDHQASLEPGELKEMVRAIRNVEVALGDGIKKPTLSELKNRLVARKSIVAVGAIRKGEPFTHDNLGSKRPGSGLSPMELPALIGRMSDREYHDGEMLHR
jgi:N,N'-diacetyllegionaminate synthase